MDEKRCPGCGEVKPTNQFFKNRARTDGLAPYCKVCHQVASTASYQRRRAELFELLGGAKCIGPPSGPCPWSVADARVLVFDHIQGGGKRHRLDAGSAYSVYRYIEAHPDEFEVRCFNCNHLAWIERGETGKAYAERVAAVPAREKVIRPVRWSRDYDACRDCGSSEAPHHGSGRCQRCAMEASRRNRGVQPQAKGKQVEPWDCAECGTTTTPRGARGLCRNCYTRQLRSRQ